MQDNAYANTADNVHLDVNAADLAALDWVKPEKVSTRVLEAALSRPKQLQSNKDPSPGAVLPQPLQQDYVRDGTSLVE